MAREPRRAEPESEYDIDALSKDVSARFDDVPWNLFDSKDLASSGETRYLVSRIEADFLKIARADPARAGRIWDEHVPGFVPRPPEIPDLEPQDVPANSIEPGSRRRKLQAEPYIDTVTTADKAQGAGDADNMSKDKGPVLTSTAGPVSDDRDVERVRLLLQGLNKQYLKADDKYHFRDKGGQVAFEVQERKLVTQHDNPSVVSSMIDLAETRGWSSLKLTGTQEFRREAWLQANLRDVEVSGYQPTKLDKVRLAELKAERKAPRPVNTIVRRSSNAPAPDFGLLADDGAGEPKIPLTPAQDQALRAMEATMRHRGDGPEAIARARVLANERLTRERIHVGKLVEVGTAPYLDRRGEKPSHYVSLEDGEGRLTKVWGVDLPRAINESGTERGQTVAVAFKGRQAVSVDIPVRDQSGQVLRTEQKTIDRNIWDIVPFEKLREDAKTAALAAARKQNRAADIQVFDRAAKPSKPLTVQAPDRRPTLGRSI